MEEAVTKQHAHPNTVFHRLKDLAKLYNKAPTTISNWINIYEETGTCQHAQQTTACKYTVGHRKWLCEFYTMQPLAYLDEAQEAFKHVHHLLISKSSVWWLSHECGQTRKVLVRRAMHIKERDVFRFVEELSQIDWSHSNLVFLDEVSFDNRGMGYALRGQTIAIRGGFQRKHRVSILAFIGVHGLIDYYDTQGTLIVSRFFNAAEILSTLRRFHSPKS
ncbi:hypothetical protein PHMEG_00036688 [Phytophthora megakarya]|uniref:Transposase n=1 Tax=Phytophthora megakarya TaxID=4795 RepID=A0A225UKY3_9STRA|nr:hypothetical protein PHMEG_00036688 [Phytophthora megakarya]